jgi:hypothetical protein
MESNASAKRFSAAVIACLFCDIRPNKKPSMDRFAAKDEHLKVSHEARKIFMHFFIANHFGVVAAVQLG